MNVTGRLYNNGCKLNQGLRYSGETIRDWENGQGMPLKKSAAKQQPDRSARREQKNHALRQNRERKARKRT